MDDYLNKIDTALNRLQGAYAPNTLKSYYADARAFVDWCGERNVEPFPIRSKTLCAYIEYLQQNAAYSSIRRLKRSKCLEQNQAVGINHYIFVKMIAAQPDTLAGTRNRALLSLGYDFLARRSELVAIRSDDLKFMPDGALKGMIRKSKTDQYGRGRLVFGSERSAKLVRKWLRLKPQDIQPVFCATNHGRCEDRAICDRNVNDIIKRSVVRVKRCERPSDWEVSGHSLRVGAAQDLLIKGYDLAAIMRAGGWSDPSTVSRYLRFSQHNIWK